jgi:large conductance mechanosensitive channel
LAIIALLQASDERATSEQERRPFPIGTSLAALFANFYWRKPRMSMIQEFKNFALKGNVMDLAIGVIIGGAFSTIVNSIVKDLIMPVVGLATGGLDFSNLFIRLGHVPATFKGNPDSYKDLQTAGIAVFGYGAFITVLINFIILAFIIFLMVKFINNLHKPSQAAPAATPEDVLLLREIRDSLKNSPRV